MKKKKSQPIKYLLILPLSSKGTSTFRKGLCFKRFYILLSEHPGLPSSVDLLFAGIVMKLGY